MQFGADALLREYKTMGLEGLVVQASPHERIRMLLDGCLERIATAKAQLERSDQAGKGQSISKALAILDGLRSALDADRGGEVAANLESLYEYCSRRLLEASAGNDPAVMSEVETLLTQIRDAWIAIGDAPHGHAA
ncbi:MAG: flagellar export chaperone FliS [Pseudomonadota bacterium]